MNIKTYHNILDYLKGIIKNHEFEGHVFSVGGCERDKHLGLQEIKDIDLVVDLKDGGIRFANWLHGMGLTKSKVVVYENFGTAMFRLSAFPDEEIEVVCTRKEIYRDKNSRNPETDFGTIEEDCHRRDFTVNALYHNISNDKDIDFSGHGLEDLEYKVIRTCADPDITFQDDPLRIMRAVRFTSKLGFDIHTDTIIGIKKNVERLSIISQERITDEFNKIITSAHPVYGFKLLKEYGILDVIMPEYNHSNIERVYERLERLKETRYYTLETALGVILNKSSISVTIKDTILKKFKYSNEIIDEVNLYAEQSTPFALACCFKTYDKVRKIAKICGDEAHFRKLVSVTHAMDILPIKSRGGIFDFLCDVEDYDLMFGYKLPVNGDDVMDILGIEPGKEIKVILDNLMDEAYKNPRISRSKCMKLIREYGNKTEEEPEFEDGL